MSLINQMLKDLDKRGGEAAAGGIARGTVRAVPAGEKSARRPLLWGLLLALIALGAVIVWLQIDQPAATTPAVPAQPVAAPAPTPAAQSVVTEAEKPAMLPAPAAAVPPAAAETTAPLAAPKVTESVKTVAPASAKAERPAQVPHAHAAEGAMKLALSGTLASIAAPEPKAARSKRAGAEGTHMAKETTPQQQTDNAYTRALNQIESGNREEAIGTLEGVLAQNPRHAAARHALVGLLVDARRNGDAIRVLKEGLQRDASQTGMAMILARLQVERGDTAGAIGSLQQSLPHAGQKPDYQAFLAALYQREKNHKQAIAHYQAALRHAPNNGVWWMGYGISLQAEGRTADARTAFGHARDTGNLSPSLRAFVEQRIEQLR